MERKYRDMSGDIDKFTQLIDGLRQRLASHKRKLEEHQREIDTRTEEIASLTAERTELMATIEKQELSPSDVERITQDRARLEEGLAKCAAQKQMLTELIQEREVQSARKLDEVRRAHDAPRRRRHCCARDTHSRHAAAGEDDRRLQRAGGNDGADSDHGGECEWCGL